MKTIRQFTVLAVVLTGAIHGAPAEATHPCTSPLVLDLDGDGRILTTGLEHGVEFDINGDGHLDSIGWTVRASGDGFLWLDLNRNGVVDSGRELFGTSMPLPAGGFADNGFDALAIYDQVEFGGNGDGMISPGDSIWGRLRLWVDRNHDGVSQRGEIGTLGSFGVVAVSLEYRELNQLDGHLNLHALAGSFVRRARVLGRMHLQELLLEDIFFIVANEER